MRNHNKLATFAKLGLVAAGGSAFLAERASHDYQVRHFSFRASGLSRDGLSRDGLTGAETASLRILHLSDTHFYQGREDLVTWLGRLAERAFQDYDLVVLTGDMLATRFGDEQLVARALEPFLESGIPGAFVFGAHDYYANRAGNPLKYLARRMRRITGEREESSLRPRELQETGGVLRGLLAGSNWLDLNNRNSFLEVAGWQVEFSGVEDPHIRRDRFVGFGSGQGTHGFNDVMGTDSAEPTSQETSGPQAAGSSLGESARRVTVGSPRVRIGLAHAPYSRVLDEFAAAGADLVFCGHTHGGQVCLPGGMALVSNCDLPPAFASGVFSWKRREVVGEPGLEVTGGVAPGEVGGVGNKPLAASWGEPVRGYENPALMRVSVSPGLGTSPFTPWRVFCPPAAYLVELL